MVAVGEESNQLEKVLINIAEALEKRTARQLELFVRLLEPVMLLVMALITLLVVAGLLLPVFKMSGAVRGKQVVYSLRERTPLTCIVQIGASATFIIL